MHDFAHSAPSTYDFAEFVDRTETRTKTLIVIINVRFDPVGGGPDPRIPLLMSFNHQYYFKCVSRTGAVTLLCDAKSL